MKELLVFLLLAGSLFILICVLDLILGFPLSSLLAKELRPFKVMEQTEFTILGIFALYFIVKGVVAFLKKRLNKTASQNQSE